jgi:cytidylate kinase
VTATSPDSGKGIVICVSGMAGCGKSTVARKIAKRYKLRYVSGGDVLKALALEAGYKSKRRGWWESPEGMRFLKERTRNFSFDREVDERLLKLAEKGNVVLDSWALPWLLKGGFRIWLEASQPVRAQRIAERDGISVAEARAVMRNKDAETKLVYRSLYGFRLGEDLSPFDLILDVNHLCQQEVFEALSLTIDRLLQP